MDRFADSAAAAERSMAMGCPCVEVMINAAEGHTFYHDDDDDDDDRLAVTVTHRL